MSKLLVLAAAVLVLLATPVLAQDTVTIEKVVDPTTIVAKGGTRITLLGIGETATGAYTSRDLVDRLSTLVRGRQVVLVRDSLVRDIKGKPIARYVFKDGELVNLVLISNGLMRADESREYQHRTAFMAAQAEARSNRIGGWQIEGFDPNAVVMTVNPNPVHEASMINYRLPNPCPVVLEILDSDNRVVAKLVDERQIPGSHTAGFQRLTLPDGRYSARLTAGGTVVSQEITLVGGTK